MRSLFVAGNWKMNTNRASAAALAAAIAREPQAAGVDVAVCPPFPYLLPVAEALAGSSVELGAQNAYFASLGAFTGEVAVEMLLDVGCRWVIVGHSERRHILGETDELINKKVDAATSQGLRVIFCVGELLSEREAGRTEGVLDSQLKGGLAGLDGSVLDSVVIAYEPVWAIGTGVTASPEQAEAAHRYIRNWLVQKQGSEVGEKMRILYGGSVKADNAATLLGQENVDDALVGGASLTPEQFLPIVRAAATVARG